MLLKPLSPILHLVEFTDAERADTKLVEKLVKTCTYRDKRLDYQLSKLRRNRWMDRNVREARIAELEAQQQVCLLRKNANGGYAVPSGLWPVLKEKFGAVVQNTPRPSPRPISFPWKKQPHQLRPYQDRARELLLREGHAAIELPTGSGKSLLALYLVHELGLKTVIMAPSTSIADQLHTEFTEYLGKSVVGKFYGGQKEPNKKVVVAVAASLTRVEPGSSTWNIFQEVECFIADEAHRCPAATLEKVCFGLVARAPYRFFLSATQLREDGLGLLLEAITGPVVMEMTLKEGVDAGFLARPRFRMVRLHTDSRFRTDDILEMNRVLLMYNPEVLKRAAMVVNAAVRAGHQVLVLIDEIQQFVHLRPLLKGPVAFAHGPADGFNDPEPTQLVKEFNAGRHAILVGTSCISEGTDTRPVKTMIYLKGGKSEIDVRQSLGRCTRRVEGKTECNVVDFDVFIDGYDDKDTGGPMHRHALARKRIYEEVYPPVEMVKL